MLAVDRAMNDWRDLSSVEEICDSVIQIISDCAPGTHIYTGPSSFLSPLSVV